MAKRRRRKGIPLPWEERGSALRRLVAGARWKLGLVIVVLAVTAFLIGRVANNRARIRTTRATIDEIHRALNDYRAATGQCPRSVTDLLRPARAGAHYLRSLPTDSWGKAILVRCPAPMDPQGAEVVSAGPSGSFFVDDNIM